MTCNALVNPTAVDDPHPLLNWELESGEREIVQVKYRICVATSGEKLAAGEYDAWDSGEVESGESQALYAGSFRPEADYYWQVTVWDNRGRSATSAPARFGAGIVDWEGAAFLSDGPDIFEEAAGLRADEYTVTCAFRLLQSNLGLIFGARDGQNFYMWQVGEANGKENPHNGLARGDKKVRLRPHLYEHSRVDLLDEIDISHIIPWEARFEPHVLRVEVRGRTVETYIDDVLADRRDDLPFAGGGLCGFRQEHGDDGLREQACVRALRVEAGGKTLFSTDFSKDNPFGRGRLEEDGLLVGRDGYTRYWLGDRAAQPCLRRPFRLDGGAIRSAKVYASALGLYELFINGQKAGDHYFAPGWTDYNCRLAYQCYDVTGLVRAGDNVIGAALAPGWFSGRLGIAGAQEYGAGTAFIAKLAVEYADGRRQTLVTDESWTCSLDGPVLAADLLDGETYDARREWGDGPAAFTLPMKADDWQPVYIREQACDRNLRAQVDPPVRAVMELPAREVWEQDGKILVDFGQNFAGVVRLALDGQAGQTVTLRFGEVLEADRSLHTENLRSAANTDRYICKGGRAVWQPRFTFHGFRYAEIDGIPFSSFRPEDIVGLVLQSDLPVTGDFSCTSELVNQLYSNICWGQRGNYLSVPTDCPQRDERRGWTGDAEVFVRTGCYNMDSRAFYAKFLTDMRDDQRADGAYPDVAPTAGVAGAGNAAWGDAGVIAPWTLYCMYGDLRIIKDNYEAMQRWIAYYEGIRRDGIIPDCAFGDWLSIGEETPKDLVATAFFGYSTGLLANMAGILSRATGEASYAADCKKYIDLFSDICTAYNRRFVDPETGRCGNGSQCSYVLSLAFQLLPRSLRRKAADLLADNIVNQHGGHLTTGFVSVGRLCPILARYGHEQVAYNLLTNEGYPSWGYSIRRGATTIWERWNSCLDDGSIDRSLNGMNSLNHYSLGAVGEWLYSGVLGIDWSASALGFKHIRLRPCPVNRPDIGMTGARGAYHSVQGRICSGWHWDEAGRLYYETVVPAGTTARLELPQAGLGYVYVDGLPATAAPGVYPQESEGDDRVYRLGSGRYAFCVCPPGVEPAAAEPMFQGEAPGLRVK